MNFFVLIDPSKINVKMLMWIAGVIAAIGIWAMWTGESENKELLESKGVMNVEIDPQTKLPMVDLVKGNTLRDQSFHAAIIDKEFLVKGVEISVAITKENKEKNITNKEDFYTLIYSDIVNPECLTKLQSALDDSDIGSLDIKEFVVSICGNIVKPLTDSKPAKEVANVESIQDLCKSVVPCAPCLIVKSGQVPVGQCESKSISFRDKSSVLSNSSGKWVNVEFKPTKKLSYMKYDPQ